jgi:hypothetical protein
MSRLGKNKANDREVAEFNPDGTPKLLGHSDISESLGLNRGMISFIYAWSINETRKLTFSLGVKR